jgi:hypothetical protein
MLNSRENTSIRLRHRSFQLDWIGYPAFTSNPQRLLPEQVIRDALLSEKAEDTLRRAIFGIKPGEHQIK